MEIKRIARVIFICPYCGSARSRLPTCGILSGEGGEMYAIGLCTSCGPVYLELLALCGQVSARSYLN